MGKTLAEKILELVRYANVESQRPLVEDELVFIARYPAIARKLLTLNSPDYQVIGTVFFLDAWQRR